MITELIVRGSRETSFHDYTLVVVERTLTFSTGSYFRNGVEQFKSTTESTINLPSEGYFDVWLTEDGFVVSDGNQEIVNPIDRLAWVTATVEETNVHFVKIVDTLG